MFSQRLKELRKKAGLSQVQLAVHMQVTQQAVGKWETGRSSPDLEALSRLAQLFNVSVDYLLGREEASPAPLSAAPEVMVPVIGTVRAGYGALAFEEDYGREPANVRNPDEYFYLMVRGDSMEPRISDGDLALVHRQETLDDGDLGVLIYGEGEGTLKKFIRRGNTVILQPFNSSYQPLVLTGDELTQLHVVGKVRETKTKW